MATESDLARIHVFPSEASYNTNKDSVSDSEISLVKTNVLEKLKGNSAPTLTALVDWDTMTALNNGNDVRNINNTSRGTKAYGGDSSFPSTEGGSDSAKGTILLKQPYTDFDKILVVGTNDSGEYETYELIDVWLLQNKFATGYSFPIFYNWGNYWVVLSGVQSGTATHKLSTTTVWYVDTQDCGIVEIYGVKY